MQNLQTQLRRLISEIADMPGDFAADAHLYLELGIPSVKAMQLLMELEERYGVQVPDDEFVEATSLQALTGMMARLTGVGAIEGA
jgi:acyl carrier protein